jgi:hypothetical protein
MKNTIPKKIKMHRVEGQKTIVDRFATYKMKNKSAENTSCPHFKVGDEMLPETFLRRTSTEQTKSSATWCNMKLDLLMNNHSQCWFLLNKSSLCHKHHQELPPEAERFDSTDLSDDKSSWMKQIYNMGLLNGTITGVLNGFLQSKRKKGLFSPLDITKTTNRYSKESDLPSGVSQNMT